MTTYTQTRARRTDSATSHDAARNAVSGKADRERIAIRECVSASRAGMTAREVAAAIGVDYIECQRRISECGLIKTEKRRSGCAVWMTALAFFIDPERIPPHSHNAPKDKSAA